MYARNFPIHLVRALTQPRFAATALVTLAALLSAACSQPTAPINSPPHLLSRSSGDQSTAASNFRVLAKTAVTCTGGTIAGDVGTFVAAPTGSVTQTGCPITGQLRVGDEAANPAFNDFLSTYAARAPKPEDVCTTLTGTLAARTLSPGSYCFDAAATLTGVLTLDGPSDGVWNFSIGTGGVGALTGTGFSVAMSGGGQACNVTWWVAQATTMTDSNLAGKVLAGAGITLTRGTFRGNASAKADATITGTAVTGCAS
jgi:hypothetical protein